MNKKIMCIVSITILMLGIMLVQPISAQKEEREYKAKLKAIGFIRIDSKNYEIKGFVLFGKNADESLFFKKIDIKYDGTEILVTIPTPFIYNIQYNPAE